MYLVDGQLTETADMDVKEAKKNTIAYGILQAHNQSGNPEELQIKFDAMLSHDITYVGIIQQARASGMTQFPLPYAMTNCHNSLCAVGGTINEDDHVFGLSAAKKYGGIFVPPNVSVIHSYAREEMAKCGAMILGSDSHTRYGALGTMAVGEGGPELAKQLLNNTWDNAMPEVALVYLTGAPNKGIGPNDVAIARVGATFSSGFVKNRVLEFAGPGVANLPMDFRNGIDVMTTETTCLSSIWETDEITKGWFDTHKRPEDYKELKPGKVAYYDRVIEIDLSKMESMIALPFHPSNAYTVHYFNEHAKELLTKLQDEAKEKYPSLQNIDYLSLLKEDGVYATQGFMGGCSGGMFDSIQEAAAILDQGSTGNDYFSLSIYPTSIPVNLELTKIGALTKLMQAGAIIKPSFCGPCFGAGDTPANNGFSLRHATRNFPNRDGSKPGDGQFASVCLMDGLSIAATAANGGKITAATDIDYTFEKQPYHFDKTAYEKRIYYGYGKGDSSQELIMGPNITDWPNMYELSENILLELAAVIHDPVTTTDELIPSGETSSLRSNPLKLSQYALSRRVPEYPARANAIAAQEGERREGKAPAHVKEVLSKVGDGDALLANTQYGSCVFAHKPGDGSAREQAASCQKVLGGFANICYEYATKRYRSNCINWGILPFTIDKDREFTYEDGDCVFVPGIRKAVESGTEDIPAKVICKDGKVEDLMLHISGLTEDEKEIILQGCLMNFYAAKNK